MTDLRDIRDNAGQISTVQEDTPDLSEGVTAVVVSHNSARHLGVLRSALVAGSVSPKRMLVIDNASTDDTVACALLAGFEIYETGANEGFGAACNAGLRMASTEYILFCNPDAIPSPQALEHLLTELAGTPAAAIAGAAIEEPLRARGFSCIAGNIWSFLPSWLQGRLEGVGKTSLVDASKDHVVVDYAAGAFILCRTAVLRSIGGFDTRFFLYNEEEDLSRRLSQRGWQTLLVPSAIVAHEDSASSEGVNKEVMGPFRFHSLYLYYLKYHSRGYAELGRCLIAACITFDRMYRALSCQRQVYGSHTALAPFRSIQSIRHDHSVTRSTS